MLFTAPVSSPFLVFSLFSLTFLDFGGSLLFSGFSTFFLFTVLLVTNGESLVVEEINHDIPFVALGEFTSENSDFSSNEPVDHGDGFSGSVVAGDGNIDEAKRRVRVAESNDGDVDVAGFLDGLEVRLRISDDDDSGFLVLEGLVIGKSTYFFLEGKKLIHFLLIQ